MIRNPEMIREFEDERVRRNPADYQANLKVFEALWEHATKMGALPPKDPLEGLEVDLRLAKALNVLSFSPYEREAIERAVEVEIGNSLVRFATAEDLIVHKVLAGRARDLEDVRSILLKNPEVDRSLITGALASFQESLDQGTTLTDRFNDLCGCLDTKHDL